MTFGAHKIVYFKPFLDYLYELWQLLSALYSDVRKKILYRCTSTFSTVNYCNGIFFKSLSYLHEVVLTNFFTDFWTFAIFDRNFANIVVPSSDENENCVALVKGLSLLKKCWKPHQNWSINRNAMIVWTMHHVERTTCRIGAWQKKTNTIFSHLQPVRIVRSPQTLHSGRARHAHPKRFQPFFDPVHSFSVGGQNVDFWLLSKNKYLPTDERMRHF